MVSGKRIALCILSLNFHVLKTFLHTVSCSCELVIVKQSHTYTHYTYTVHTLHIHKHTTHIHTLHTHTYTHKHTTHTHARHIHTHTLHTHTHTLHIHTHTHYTYTHTHTRTLPWVHAHMDAYKCTQKVRVLSLAENCTIIPNGACIIV